MWSLVMALLVSGCSSSTPTQQAPAPRVGKVKGKGAKAKRPPTVVGVAGPVLGELKLTVLETEMPNPQPPGTPAEPDLTEPAEGTPAEGTPAEPAPTEPAPTEPPPAGAPGKPIMAKHTQADLMLTFSDGQTLPVRLGKVTGTCTEVPVTPIGPAANPQTPLWSVQCVDAVTTSDLAILQLADQLTVLRAMPTPGGEVQYRPVKRVRLASGATVQRKPSG